VESFSLFLELFAASCHPFLPAAIYIIKYHRGEVSCVLKVKVKVIPQQAEVAQGVPGRLRPQIFLTFGTTRALGRQPYTPAAFTPGEIIFRG
jgi:hypothetical protein